MSNLPWCLLLTGLPNSGKSTIAHELVQSRVRNALVIDGDKHRQMQFMGKLHGFSRADIMENNLHVIKMARFAQDQDMSVIIAQIAPYLEQRQQMRRLLNNFCAVSCKCDFKIRKMRPNFVDTNIVYEDGEFDLVLHTDELTVEASVDAIMEMLNA